MAQQEIERRFVRDLYVSRFTKRIENLEVRGMFAKVGAKANLTQLVPVKPVTADEHSHFTWLLRGLGNHPGCRSPGFPVVQADISFPDADAKSDSSENTGTPFAFSSSTTTDKAG